jgi:hypothetical protein
VDAKAYNRHVVTGCMKPGELISVDQEALGLLLLENYKVPWEQLVNAMNDGQQTVPGNNALETKYTNSGNKRNPWSKEGYEWYNKLHEQVHQDRLLNRGKKFKKEEENAGSSWQDNKQKEESSYNCRSSSSA